MIVAGGYPASYFLPLTEPAIPEPPVIAAPQGRVFLSPRRTRAQRSVFFPFLDEAMLLAGASWYRWWR